MIEVKKKFHSLEFEKINPRKFNKICAAKIAVLSVGS